MSSVNLGKSDAAYNQKLQEFKTGMDAYGTVLGFSTAAKNSATTASTTFSAALTETVSAKAALKGAVATKDATRKSTTTTIRALAAQVKANPLSTPEILAAFGLTPNVTPSGGVNIPSQLVVIPQTQGFAKLTWKRSGNAPATVFVIQARNADGDWVMIGTSTKSNFTDVDANPGIPKWYRIRAERGGVVSPWTNEVSIYSSGESSISLKIA